MTTRKKPSPPPKKRGRPSKWSETTARRIIEGLSHGIPLTVICSPADMPGITTVWEWQQKNPDFSEAIARARESGFDQIALDALRISDTPEDGETIVEKPDGIEIRRGDMLGHRKLRVETRLKLLAKWDPKRYGERMATEISGPDGGPIDMQTRERPDAEKLAFAAQLAKVWKTL
jgi:hypothetical protein